MLENELIDKIGAHKLFLNIKMESFLSEEIRTKEREIMHENNSLHF